MSVLYSKEAEAMSLEVDQVSGLCAQRVAFYKCSFSDVRSFICVRFGQR